MFQDEKGTSTRGRESYPTMGNGSPAAFHRRVSMARRSAKSKVGGVRPNGEGGDGASRQQRDYNAKLWRDGDRDPERSSQGKDQHVEHGPRQGGLYQPVLREGM